MKFKKRSVIQIFFTLTVIVITIVYYMYINEYIQYKIFSIGDMNPYGGWSALKSSLIDVSYRFKGISPSIALTLAISIAALIMGRFFCGFICPIGALQDFFKFLGKKLHIKEVKLPKWKYFNFEIIKYIVLILALILSILGFGNIISFYSPWISYLNLFMGFVLKKGTIVLLAIALLSLFIRRVFCRVFCPLGAFQSLLSAIGPSRIKAGEKCNTCSYCLKNCPVGIEKGEEKEIPPECIRCMECVNSTCIKGTEGYRIELNKRAISNKAYINITLVLIISIFIFLPFIDLKTTQETMVKIEGLKDGIYTGIGTGFGGDITVEVVIGESKIKGINVLSHNETTGYYEEAIKTISREIIENQNLGVDTVTGATTTSRGFINAVRRGISQALEGR